MSATELIPMQLILWIVFFWRIYSMDDEKLMFHGQATDAGGGGTRNGCILILLNRVSLYDEFLMAT